jgi:probable O-glycosylation ligase (exosortase A-associated)
VFIRKFDCFTGAEKMPAADPVSGFVAPAMPPGVPDRKWPGREIGIALVASGLVAVVWYKVPIAILPLVLGVLPFAGYVAMRNPFLLCLVFLIFSFFRIHEVFPQLEPLKIPKMLAIATLLVLGTHAVFGRIKGFWRVEFTLLLILTTHLVIGIFFATGRPIAMGYFTDTYSKIVMMTFAIAFLLTTPSRFNTMGNWLILAGIVVSIVAISNSLQGIGLVEGSRVTIGRERGSVLGDPNDLSLVLLFPIAFSAAWIVTGGLGWWSRALGVAGFAIVTWAVLLTQSRGGLLGVMAIMAVMGLRLIKSKALLIAICVVGTMGIFAAAGISGRQSGGANDISEEGLVDESAQGRLWAWTAAWRMAIANPVVGVGMNNFSANYYIYTPHWEGLAKAVHSTWFSILAEGGFVGFGVFIAMVVLTIRLAFVTIRRIDRGRQKGSTIDPRVLAMAQAMPAGLIGFVIAGSFLTQSLTWPIYILLALTTATWKYVDDWEAGVNRT